MGTMVMSLRLWLPTVAYAQDICSTKTESAPIFNVQECSSGGSCAANSDSGFNVVSEGVSLGFVTKTQYGKSVGSRLYVTEGDEYYQFNMLDKELAFDVDASELECG